MDKRFFIAWVVVFIAWMLGDMVVHGMLLSPDYRALTNLFRNEADSGGHFPLMILAHVIMAGAFVWIYARGRESKPWAGQGVRYGVAVALLTVVPWYIIYYVVQPIPGMLAVKQIVLGSILSVLLGLVAAFMYRERATP